MACSGVCSPIWSQKVIQGAMPFLFFPQHQDTGGSPRYMAPECFLVGQRITEKVGMPAPENTEMVARKKRGSRSHFKNIRLRGYLRIAGVREVVEIVKNTTND